MNIRPYIYIGMLCAFVACSDNEVQISDVTHQPLKVAVQPTRISGTNTGVAENHELIHDYSLLFVNKQTRRIEARVDRSFDADAKEYDQVSFPIEISEVGSVDSHDYDVIAFANFTQAMAEKIQIGGKNLSEATEGTILADNYLASLKTKVINLSSPQASGVAANLNGYDFSGNNAYIPMTGVTDYVANMQYHQPVNVPLVRLMAKLRFDITNKMASEVNVNSVVITPINNREVYLLPHVTRYGTSKNAENLTVLDKTGTKLAPGEYPANPAEDGDYRYIPDLPYTTIDNKTDTIKVIVSGNLDLQTNKKKTFGTTYVSESLAKWHPTRHFAVNLKFTTDNGTVKEARYALSGDDFIAVCRNDEVVIPLTISDEYAIEPEIEFYPPIGGYPAVVDKRSDDEFYVYFGSEGDFAIYADVLKDGKKTGFSISNTEIFHFGKDDDVQIEYLSGDESMFTTVPSYKESDNAFIGTMSNTPGHAILTFTVKVKGTNALITKKVHIIRD